MKEALLFLGLSLIGYIIAVGIAWIVVFVIEKAFMTDLTVSMPWMGLIIFLYYFISK